MWPAPIKGKDLYPDFLMVSNGATIDSMPAPLKAAFLKVTPDKDKLLNMFNKDVERMKNFRDIPDDAIRRD